MLLVCVLGTGKDVLAVLLTHVEVRTALWSWFCFRLYMDCRVN